ncbi:MAG: response regulator [Gemmatimonadota bacterium]|nr:MAG: response regulator [Gemmatimonadota bacterium]
MAKILVIDDEEGVRRAIGKVLVRAGYEALEAPDGKVALSLLKDEPPDLVICDLFMPEMDGVEVLRELRRHYPDLRVVAISGGAYHGKVELLDVAKGLGAVAVLKKPFQSQQLLDVIHEQLGDVE